MFQELINEDKKYKEVFDGFTYYRNSLGGFSSTYLSIPLILTGQYYDNSVPINEYLKEAYNNSLFPILKSNNYNVELYTDKRLVYNSPDIASNIIRTSDIVSKNDIKYLYNITFYKYMPHNLKRYFYKVKSVNGDIGSDNDLVFVNKILNEAKALEDKYSFKFIHLWGVHPPFSLNENLQKEDLEFNRSGYKTQGKAVIKIIDKFLSSLKNLEIYDDSMIFIVGDHGIGASGSMGLNLQSSGYTEDNKSAFRLRTDETIASAIPLILVKPFSIEGEMKVSDAPVSSSDIAKTIFVELGLAGDIPGCSMFSIKETEKRERRFMSYVWENEYVNEDFISPMDEYLIDGFRWLKKSWIPTYCRYFPKVAQDAEPEIYKYGEKIKFGLNEEADKYKGFGWGGPENGLTWTNGHYASYIIPPLSPKSDVTLVVQMMPFTSEKIKNQKVNLYISGKIVCEWNATKQGEYKVMIPKDYIKENSLSLVFELPDAISPISVNAGNDNRILGIGFQSIKITEPGSYKFDTNIKLGIDGNASIYQLDGWSIPENGLTWIEGKKTSISLKIDAVETDLTLSANIIPLLGDEVEN